MLEGANSDDTIVEPTVITSGRLVLEPPLVAGISLATSGMGASDDGESDLEDSVGGCDVLEAWSVDIIFETTVTTSGRLVERPTLVAGISLAISVTGASDDGESDLEDSVGDSDVLEAWSVDITVTTSGRLVEAPLLVAGISLISSVVVGADDGESDLEVSEGD